MFLSVLAFALANGGVRAEPLDAATCAQLKGEQVRMEQAGVRGNMEKGPAWAKSNLAADKLEQIRRLMELDEQLLVPMPSRNLVVLPPDADADPAPTPAKADDDGKDPASSKTDAAPAPQKKPGTGARPPRWSKPRLPLPNPSPRKQQRRRPRPRRRLRRTRAPHLLQTKPLLRPRPRRSPRRTMPTSPRRSIPLSTRSPTRRRDNKWAWGLPGICGLGCWRRVRSWCRSPPNDDSRPI